MANPVGRPREHDRDQVAKDLIEWAKKDDSINLNKFCAYYDPIIPPSKISEWAKEDSKFREAYQSAKSFLGYRREEMLNKDKLHVKAYDLNATTYDHFLKEEKKEMAIFQSELTQKENEKGSTVNNIYVNPDLASGSNIPTQALPNTPDKSSK